MSLRRSNILVIQWARLGDLFHSRPLCETAQRVFHPAELILSCDERYDSVAKTFPEVDHVLPVPLGALTAMARTDVMLPELLHEIEKLGAQSEASIVINLTNHVAAQRFADAVLAEAKLGYGYDASDVLTELNKKKMDYSDKHVAHVWQSLIEPEAQLCIPRHIEPVTNGNPFKRVAVICSAGSVERSLSEETVEVIIKAIQIAGGCRVTLLGSTQDSTSNLSRWCVRDLRGKTTLNALKSKLAESSLVIGPDTGALHYAAALGRPVLGLYLADASPVTTGPLTSNAVCITSAKQDAQLHETIVEETAHIRDNLPFVKSNSVPQAKAISCDLSVIITEYAQTHYTDALLATLKSCVLPNGTEIIVMSSGLGSVDAGFAEARAGVLVDAVSHKRTFAEACNRGAMLASGQWLLFVNDDCELTRDAFLMLWQTRRANELLAPRLRHWDWLIQSNGFTFDGKSVTNISADMWNVDSDCELLDGVSAAVMLVERTVFNSLSGFDENYCNGYEDVDFCLKAASIGITSRIADCDVLHYHGSSPERYEQDDANLHRLQSKWSSYARNRSMRVRTHLQGMAPLLLLSDEPADSAGAVLRWRRPLASLGMLENVDYTWVCTQEQDHEMVAEQLRAACTVIVFRSVSNGHCRSLVVEWQQTRSNKLCYDCDDIIVGRFPAGSPRAAKRLSFESGVRELIVNADLTICSNSMVSECIPPKQGERYIIETPPSAEHFKRSSRTQVRGTFNIGYAGSAVHQTDFALVSDSLRDLLDSESDVRFYWWGAHPGELASHPQVRRGGIWVKKYETHLERVQRAEIDLWLVPLANTPHNAARSPIKAFEYIGMQAPCIFSNVQPFKGALSVCAPDLLIENDRGSWSRAMRNRLSQQNSDSFLTQLSAAREVFRAQSQDLSAYQSILNRFALCQDTRHGQKLCATAAL